MATYQVKVYLGPRQNVYHASHIFSGLDELCRQGEVALRWVAPVRAQDKAPVPGPLTVLMDVWRTGEGICKSIAIDLHDRHDEFDVSVIRDSDVYFKRTFHRPEEYAPVGTSRQVLPFGLNYACRTPGSFWRLCGCLGREYVRQFLSDPAQFMSSKGEYMHAWWIYLHTPHFTRFEQSPSVSLRPVILLQTRVWRPGELLPDSAEEINAGRVQLVRTLRHAFGRRFVGGLIPTDYAREHYPDDLTNAPTRKPDYIRLCRRALIGIVGPGRARSEGFSMGEYIAGSKCMVAKPVSIELPQKLEDGAHYLAYRTADECVERCSRLLEGAALRDRLRRNVHDYYRRQLQPAARMKNCLDRAFDTVDGVAS